MQKALVPIAILVGIVLIVLAGYYWITPAGQLPGFIPGFEPGVTSVHFKHGLGCAILGLALFAFAWFRSGSKATAR